ncbi:MAG: hypothetical protein HXX16_08095 [Bacteroidales bacterium]|nr:hypothetical protein [Bacteroidales bacterium]
MKKIILSIFSLILLVFLQTSCNKDDAKPNKKEGTVEFGFSLKAPSHSGVQKSSMKTLAVEPAAIVVSIKKANGNSAYTMQKVYLYNMNGYYISKPLSLLPGNYTIEQFFVVDAAGNVMYATPLQGSPKAYLVNEPLPINFTVSKDAVTKIVPEVLSTEDLTPEDFGYSTFSFKVVNTFDFLIGVFVYNESTQNFELTNANLTIVAASKTIFTNTLAAITNKITINDGYDFYRLTISKDGYKTWIDSLSAADLKLYFRSEDKGPLKVILENGNVLPKSIRFTTDQTTLDFLGDFQMRTGSQGVNLVINWGDGVSQNISLLSNATFYGIHKYNNTGVYEVTISGEVDKLIGFTLNQNKSVTSIDITKAINLESLILNDNKINVLDVTHNQKLKWFDCSYNTISEIDLSNNTKIENLGFSNTNITSINLSKQPELKSFYGNYNKLINLDFSCCNKIQSVQCSDNPNLNDVIIGKKDSLKVLEVWENALTSLDISGCPNLQRLVCYHNKLSALNLSNNPLIVEINCGANNIVELNLSDNKELMKLCCTCNQITSIDLSSNKKLVDIRMHINPIPLNIINKFFADVLAGVIENPRVGIIYQGHNPSGQGLLDKERLISDYGWIVY